MNDLNTILESNQSTFSEITYHRVSERIYSLIDSYSNKKIIISLAENPNEEPLFLMPKENRNETTILFAVLSNDTLKVSEGTLPDYLEEIKIAKEGLTLILSEEDISNSYTLKSAKDFLNIITTYISGLDDEEND
jgi:hypothetical protein